MANANQVSAAGFSDIYVLGDSLSDQGNLFNATEELAGTGIPDAEFYYVGRFSDDENYADALAARLGLTLVPSSEDGNNFAFGGARTDYNRVNDLADLTAIMAFIPLPDPAQFANDFINKVVGGIDGAIEKFVDAGAQHIIVPNVPNLGVVPSVTDFGPAFSGLATELSGQYNEALDEMLTTWEGRVNIIKVDTYSLLAEVAHNPAEFGFANAGEACYNGFVSPLPPGEELEVCDDPETYVFWDRIHPTSAFHQLMADFMLSATLEDILDDLMNQVTTLDLHKGTSRSLSAKLETAIMKLDDDSNAASRVLNAFVNSVEAQAGKKIAIDNAAMLIKRAELVLHLLTIDGA